LTELPEFFDWAEKKDLGKYYLPMNGQRVYHYWGTLLGGEIAQAFDED